ncbi:nucleotide sugar dehydrogenase [Carnobacterium sp. FSL E2-0243]|uniref:nucleotide sugar dehydrogenase n=1 Tax=Carnobacterium sp. FSL E2-0243 TaxID=2921365 RepID=UPI0030F5ECB1
MKIVTMGLGYIGLPTSVMFANHGQEVIGVDINKNAVEMLKDGKIHIEEPGLQEALENALASGNFKPKLTPETADVFILAVPTPNNEDTYKSCDLTYLLNALKTILPYVKKGNTVIVESTIAPRSTEDYVVPLIEAQGFTVGEDIFVVHCPERVLPGKVLEELVYNNRIIGGVTEKCTLAGKKVYEIFVQGDLILTEAKTAELSKLMENTYRDVNIALANELVKISSDLSINALDVIEMANKHPRVNLHQPGPGVGGHCLAVDPYFITAASPKYSPLIQLARQINTSMPDYVIDTSLAIMEKVKGTKIAVLGLTYKGDIDDIRESPAMEIYSRLKKETNFEVSAFDPHVEKEFVEKDIDKALEGADLVLILSDHSEFKQLKKIDFQLMNNMNILDTKNILSIDATAKYYYNLGNLFEVAS